MARTKHDPTPKNDGPRDQDSAHDGMFRRTFSVPQHAASELKSILPEELVRRIRWGKLRTASDKFVGAQLDKRYADILFEVEIDDEAAFIHVLFEHKSAPEKWTLLQLLEYMIRIWRTFLREQGNTKVRRLPVILPVVLHHGESGWTAPRRFIEYFGDLGTALRPFVPDFGIVLDDVAKVHLDQLLGRPLTAEAKIVLFCLRFGRSPETFFQELPRLKGALEAEWRGPEKGVALLVIVRYMQKVAHIPPERTIMALQKLLELSPAEEIIFIEEAIRREGLREGWERGKLEGILEGKREGILEGKREGILEGKREGTLHVVSQMLEKRFGSLPLSATKRVESASESELEEMALRILSATTLDEVLGKSRRKRKQG